MSEPDWKAAFRDIYDRARRAYEEGAATPRDCVNASDRSFLAEIGCSPQELYDLVEDDVTLGEPGIEVALELTEVRREYFLHVDQGQAPERLRRVSDFPSPGDTLGGIPWLPRILAKARAKLRGELPPELMYGCGGDRRFLREHGLGAAEFLRTVWKAGDHDEEVLACVRRQTPG